MFFACNFTDMHQITGMVVLYECTHPQLPAHVFGFSISWFLTKIFDFFCRKFEKIPQILTRLCSQLCCGASDQFQIWQIGKTSYPKRYYQFWRFSCSKWPTGSHFVFSKNEKNRNLAYVWVHIFPVDHHVTMQFHIFIQDGWQAAILLLNNLFFYSGCILLLFFI